MINRERGTGNRIAPYRIIPRSPFPVPCFPVPGYPPVMRLWIIALTLASLALSACKQSTPASTPKTAPLTLWHTFNPDETPTLNRVLASVKARRPGMAVQATVIPFARAQNELRRAGISCGEGAPDLFRAELPWVAELVSRGLVHPVPEGLVLGGAAYCLRMRSA